MHPSTLIRLASASLLTLAAPSLAQLSISWSTIDSGGGTSTGASTTLSGTIGQTDAGVMTGGGYTLAGGFWTGSPGVCYANCDQSTTAPVLNVADFTCFLQKFAAGDAYANCDQSTQPPVLNVADFTCFLQRFAGGCP